MDLDTENRLAALLMEEARRLRAEADKDGVHVYLNRKVRARPNSRFLTATVLGVQHVLVDWLSQQIKLLKLMKCGGPERRKELDLKNRSIHKAKEIPGCSERDRTSRVGYNRTRRDEKTCKDSEYSHNVPQKRDVSSIDDDDGLKDEDVEQFLNSRVKRGRGAVGSRMDETGPYPTCGPSNQENKGTCSELRVQEDWERKVLGPEKPSSYRSYDSEEVPRKTKKSEKSISKKHYSSNDSSEHDKHRKKRRKRKKIETSQVSWKS